MRTKANYPSSEFLKRAIAIARGHLKADLVLKNCTALDVFRGRFIKGDIAIYGEYIVGLGEEYNGEVEVDLKELYVVPGFIDSHVHIESSLMTPARFEQAVLSRGTTTAIWDPHEIANVKGRKGIEWALEASRGLLMDIFIMLPSCVPTTHPDLKLETNGAQLELNELKVFKNHPRILGLAEMMNFSGVLNGEKDVIDKIFDFQNSIIDGHCPGLRGKDLNAYAVSGVHSCHESTSLNEASEKLMKGVHTLIREGSCAKNAQALLPLLNAYTSVTLSLCSDDRNPADIFQEGHLDFIINLALKSGHKPEDIFRAASYAPSLAFSLGDRGALAPGYKADLCIIEPIEDFKQGCHIKNVYKKGHLVNNQELQQHFQQDDFFQPQTTNINIKSLSKDIFQIPCPNKSTTQVQVIEVIPNQIITKKLLQNVPVCQGELKCDPSHDLLKISVIERHHATGNHACGLVKGFGLRQGAIATSINHDSHNVIVVGADEESMLKAVELLVKIDGGIVVYKNSQEHSYLPLPIGGLMTQESPEVVSQTLLKLKALTGEMGCLLHEPFLQLSFLALTVVPELKITDRGLVDVNQMKLTKVVVE